MSINPKSLHPEIVFQTARSGGKGGQNVNKVETKVELRFDVLQSAVLPDHAKQLIMERLANKISGEGILVIQNQTERSQLANKLKVLLKFDELIKKALIPVVRRKKTRPPAAVEANRRRAKERTSEIKKWRAKPEI